MCTKFFHVITYQESKLWVFENKPKPAMVKRKQAMKKVMYAYFLQKYKTDQSIQTGTIEDSCS